MGGWVGGWLCVRIGYVRCLGACEGVVWEWRMGCEVWGVGCEVWGVGRWRRLRGSS